MISELEPREVRVLVVDDDPATRLGLVAILEPLGYSVVEASSGTEALRCLLVQTFAVILLDVRMPGMDGFETAALIRMRAESEMTPIIFITAYDPADMTNANLYAQGAVDFMYAPVAPHELRAKVSVFANLFLRAEELADRARFVQDEADQLRMLMEAAPIGVFQTDAQGRFVYTNPEFSTITGISADTALGNVFGSADISAWADCIVVSSPEADLGDGEQHHRAQLHVNGEDRVLVARSRPILKSGGATRGRVGIVSDVTDEVRAETALSDARDKATAASVLKSDFLANMSHEIRTPMNGVIGMTEMLLETNLDATQRDYSETIRNSGEALLAIINDILDFSKIEAGMVQIEDLEFCVGTVVEEVVKLLRVPAELKGLTLCSVIDVNGPLLVRGDPGRLRQVLTNLIGNAVKFTAEGGVEVRVACVAIDDEGATLQFNVVDTGEGIPAAKLSAICEPFVQADSSTSRKYGGTGLGLAISRQLITLMGGDFGLASEVGRGSDFWFTVRTHNALTGKQSLPRPIGDASSASRGAGNSDIRPVSPRLLLAEDNVVNEKVATAMLRSAGYEVDSVRNGMLALEALERQRYAAVLMDCQMPELDGYDATVEIRAREGQRRHTPVIALTASARYEDRQRCFAAGMDAYVSKPVSRDALLAVVARWVAWSDPAGRPPGSLTRTIGAAAAAGAADRVTALQSSS